MNNFVELVRVLAWPILIAGGLIAFYHPLHRFVGDISKRVNKLTAFGIELELGVAKEDADRLNAELLKLETRPDYTSSESALLEELKDPTRLDYSIIDLGNGREWVTSRLFLFAVLLQKRRRLRCFVFVESKEGSPRRFIGTATPTQVRQRLGERFPWLEATFMNVSEAVFGFPISNSPGVEPKFDTDKTCRLVKQFLDRIQAPVAQPPVKDWVLIRAGKWERADWLTRETLATYLSTSLNEASIKEGGKQTDAEIVRQVLRNEGTFIALLKSNETFDQLVNRGAMLEELAKVAARAE